MPVPDPEVDPPISVDISTLNNSHSRSPMDKKKPKRPRMSVDRIVEGMALASYGGKERGEAIRMSNPNQLPLKELNTQGWIQAGRGSATQPVPLLESGKLNEYLTVKNEKEMISKISSQSVI